MTRLRSCRLAIIFLFCVAAAIAAPAQNVFFTTLANFAYTNGAYPAAGLVQAGDGNFYGTTNDGGNCRPGCGTVFKMTPAGTLTTLYSFCSQRYCVDGSNPLAQLVVATDGNFYGTTSGGGYYNDGTVFKITSAGTLTTLYSFGGADGVDPEAGLVQATDGNFYGTTYAGGNLGCFNGLGCGSVFKITPNGTLTTLHSFDGTDGAFPYSWLVQGTDGNLYGTTWGDGSDNHGTIFKITPAGVLTTLYSFVGQNGCVGGCIPWAGLVQASDGNFYGTGGGGAYYDAGVIFKISPAGTFTTVYSFCASGPPCSDGMLPYAGLVQGSDGNLYGTTTSGGRYQNCNGEGCGTVFKITLSGILTTLHSFNNSDGADPFSGWLVQGRDGSLFGTATSGGAYGYGTVFRVGVVRTCATCRR